MPTSHEIDPALMKALLHTRSGFFQQALRPNHDRKRAKTVDRTLSGSPAGGAASKWTHRLALANIIMTFNQQFDCISITSNGVSMICEDDIPGDVSSAASLEIGASLDGSFNTDVGRSNQQSRSFRDACWMITTRGNGMLQKVFEKAVH